MSRWFLNSVILVLSVVASYSIQPCPRKCTCRSPLVYSVSSIVVDCSNANLTYVPSQKPEIYKLIWSTLILKGNQIEHINHFDFDGLENLVSLDLTGNPIKNIPGYVFIKLKYLKTLEIQTETLETTSFHGLFRLKRLKVVGSPKITFFDNALLRPMVHTLQELFIHGTSVQHLPKDILSGFLNLKTVKLSHNEIATIDKNAFLHSSFQTLDLSSNSLAELALDDWDGMNDLKNLNISKNNITSLRLPFEKLKNNLRELDASHNSIADLPLVRLHSLKSLVHLNLSNNFLTNFLLDNEACTLKTLNLNDNSRLSEFATLDVRYRRFCGLSKLGLRASNLSKLHLKIGIAVLDLSMNCQLSHNDIVISPEAQKQFLAIDMSSSCLKHIPSAFLDGDRKRIDVYNNSLVNVTIYHLVDRFNMSHNQISRLTWKTSRYFVRFKMLDISGNTLNNVTISHDNVVVGNKAHVQVDELIMQSNGLHRFPEVLNNKFLGIKNLDLSHNNIKSLNSTLFFTLPNWHLIQSLSFQHNKINFINPDAFGLMLNLRRLDFSYNNLEKISNNVFGYHSTKSIVWLSLANNNFSTLIDDQFGNLHRLQHLDVQGNIFRCDCNLMLALRKKVDSVEGKCLHEKQSFPLQILIKLPIHELSKTVSCNYCPLHPCNYRGVCQPGNRTGFTCDCYRRYKGAACEIVQYDCYKDQMCQICNETYCENGGTCIEVSRDAAHCQCQRFYEGDRCQNNTNPCIVNNPCQNNGTCQLSVNDGKNISCQCSHKYDGQFCERKRMKFCDSLSCNHNGVCLLNEYSNVKSCLCHNNWQGLNCETTKEFDKNKMISQKKGISASNIGIIILAVLVVFIIITMAWMIKKYGIFQRPSPELDQIQLSDDF